MQPYVEYLLDRGIARKDFISANRLGDFKGLKQHVEAILIQASEADVF